MTKQEFAEALIAALHKNDADMGAYVDARAGKLTDVVIEGTFDLLKVAEALGASSEPAETPLEQEFSADNPSTQIVQDALRELGTEPSIRNEIMSSAASAMVSKLDDALLSACNNFLPTGWTQGDFKRRCALLRMPGSTVEIFCVDGVPTLEIHPIEVETLPGQFGFRVKFTQQYRSLRASENRTD